MERVSFIEHKGKKILFGNYANLCGECSLEEIMEVIKFETELIAKQAKKSLLTLTDVTGIYVCKDVNDALTTMASQNRPHVKKAAVVGISGIKLTFFNIMMALSDRKVKVFNDIEAAKDWLVS